VADILACRKLNKRVKLAVEKIFQEVAQQPINQLKQKRISEKTVRVRKLRELEPKYKTMTTGIASHVQQCLSHFTPSNSDANPFLLRSLHLPLDPSYEPSFHELLTRFGHHVLAFTGAMKTFNEMTQQHSFATPDYLTSMLSLVPNVKSLELTGLLQIDEDNGEDWTSDLLPELSQLEFLSIPDNEWQDEIVQFAFPLFKKYGVQLKGFACVGILLEEEEVTGRQLTEYLPNIRGFRVSDVDIRQLNKLLDVEWQLETLQIFNKDNYQGNFFHDQDPLVYEFRGVFRVAQHFASSLVEMNLQCRLIGSSSLSAPGERIVFTSLKKLTTTILLFRFPDDAETWLNWFWDWLAHICPVLEEISFEVERENWPWNEDDDYDQDEENECMDELKEIYETVLREAFARMRLGVGQNLGKVVWFDVKSREKVVFKHGVN